MLVHSSVVFSN